MATMTVGRPRNLPAQPDVDVRQIIHEAQARWLRPIEVCEILTNYSLHNFRLNPAPPNQPQSGSLFLFDRKTLRYFRKDGHNWRKKKDGKTVREAHERLKAGSVDVLHCYYAHGEDNVNFQRRCYWMLEPDYEHIVLVHYREVTESNRSCPIRPLPDYTPPVNAIYHPHPRSQQPVIPLPIGGVGSIPGIENTETNGSSLSPEMEEDTELQDEFDDSGVEVEGSLPPDSELQLSLQQQLVNVLSPSNQWPKTGGNAKGLGVINGQFSSQFPPPNPGFKSSVTEMHSQPSLETASSSDSSSYLENPFRDGDVSGQYMHRFNNSGAWTNVSRGSRLNTPTELGSLPTLINNTGSFGKSVGSSWMGTFLASTTPTTRHSMLEEYGIAPGLVQTPVGKEDSPSLGASLSSQGIMDMLSPKNLGRAPQTPLEAGLRAVAEKKIIIEAEEKAQAQRSRWPGAQLEPSHLNTSARLSQDLLMRDNAYSEPDTLEGLVQRASSYPESHTSGELRDNGSWLSPAPHQLHQPQPFGFQNFFGQRSSQANYGNVQPEKDQSSLSPAPSNGLASLDSVNDFSHSVQSDEVSHQDVVDNYRNYKLDSFGRWMNTAISESLGPYLSSASSAWDSDPITGLSQMDIVGVGSPSPAISELCFDISDFSPDWSSCTGEIKVLITGMFVEGVNPSQHQWACMFGEVEVPAELLGGNALRCKAPKHGAGKVSFYVTRSDRSACSQIREFEYRPEEGAIEFRSKESSYGPPLVEETYDTLWNKIMFARMLFGSASSGLGTRALIFKASEDYDWQDLALMAERRKKPLVEINEKLMQLILKRRLVEWLQAKSREEGKGPSVHDDHGIGVPHFTAALGYVWAIDPLLKAKIPINFRDHQGWTALHWAAHCGREEVVCALLKAGALPNLLTDCNKEYPEGLTAAAVATMQGHSGIAGFLSQQALEDRLSGLKLDENILVNETAASAAGEEAVALLSRRSSIRSSLYAEDDHKVLQSSLDAVRESYRNAAIIKEHLRQKSIRIRESHYAAESHLQCDEDDVGLSYLAAQKIQKAYRGHQKNKQLHKAATTIQRKYRGWKGRREFQNFRQQIIRLQARVRGRLVRRHIYKIVWSVSIVEKVVLRWLRKRKGLRGFKADASEESAYGDDVDDVRREGRIRGRHAVEKDVATVQDMARNKRAREQYNRLRERILKGGPLR